MVPVQGAAPASAALDDTVAVHVSPSCFGTTVRQCHDVARLAARDLEGTPVVSELYPLREFPHALTAMKRLVGPQPRPTLSARRLVVAEE